MELFLIRHADAVPLSDGIKDDAERPLSEKGEQQAQMLAKGLQKRGVGLDQLVTSPLLRARQTADIMLKHWTGTPPELLTCDALVPDAKPRQLRKYLRKLTGERIGLVGHLPHIAVFAGWLIGGKRTQVDFAKAGVACIACGELAARGLGTLQWLVTPAWLEV